MDNSRRKQCILEVGVVEVQPDTSTHAAQQDEHG
jgi:hypothetical protein